ncbi:WW domain [Phytophthora cactorum]|nr:WW domain [Phytophthora cactorum]
MDSSIYDNGHVYYLNTETMETQWTPPSAAVENEEDTSLSSDTVNGRARKKPSTAEQLTELNRCLVEKMKTKKERSRQRSNIDHYEETSETSTPEVGLKLR